MTAGIHKAFYVSCPDCHYEEFDFSKKDAHRHAERHDCVKFLQRQWNYSHDGIRKRFKVDIQRVTEDSA